MGINSDDEWPAFVDELDRKVTEQLDKWTSAYDAQKISKREYFILISALYDATSGLITKQISDLMADIHAELRGRKA